MTPRPYQLETLDKTERAFGEFDRVLDVLPTGAGKTIIFSFLAQRWHQRGQKTLILAHREELIDQAIDKLHTATGIRAEKEKAEFNASLDAPVVVASIQTMIRRLDKWPSDHFGKIVCDEAHHVLSDSWQTTLRHFDAQVLGVTATPDRGDMRSLMSYFQTTGANVKLLNLIKQGYLAKIVIKSFPLNIDISKISTEYDSQSGCSDYSKTELGHALEPYLDQIAIAVRDILPFSRTLAFLPLRDTSKKFVEACRKAGLSAKHIDGDSPDRKELLSGFRSWDFDVLSNAMLLTEGYDEPRIDNILVLRLTKSRPLFAQICGRGLRIAEGKPHLTILDPLYMHEVHDIVNPASLVAQDAVEYEQITDMIRRAAAMPADLAEQMPLDLQDLASDATRQREEALRKRLEANRKKQGTTVSAEEFAAKYDSLATAEYQEVSPWESQPVTEKQLKWLKRAHIDPSSVRGKGHASKLLDLYFAKKPLILASAAQRATMARMGHPNADNATADEARTFFAKLRKPKQLELA